MVDSAKRVLMVYTSHDKLGETEEKTGWYLPEAAHPYAVFKAAGYTITHASPKGGVAPLDAGSIDLNDAENKTFWEGEGKNLTETTVKLSDCKADDYDAIFFVGGFGTMWDFPEDADVHRLSKELYESGKVVSAVCHGPCALVNVKLTSGEFLIKGQEVAGFTNVEEDAVKRREIVPFTCEDKIKANGGTHKGAGVFEVCVAVSGTDGRLITGQNPPSAKVTAEAVVAKLSA